ncbi:MAG TPA: Hsp20/alpha crystallin family protein [bacterium]|nr:Hsp20/alpha crystallin family protein [bacterium]
MTEHTLTTCCEPPTAPDVTVRGRVDITEVEHGYRVEADVPGAGKDDVDIRFDNGALSFTATIPRSDGPEAREHLREFGPRRIEREFRLGDTVDVDGIRAEVERGVLTIHLPKVAQAKPHRIEIR